MANKILFISCALFCTFLLLFGSLPESVWWRAFRGERGKAITRDYATLPTSLSVTSRTHTRRYLKSAMGCKEKSNDNGLQPEGRLGLQVLDFPSSSFKAASMFRHVVLCLQRSNFLAILPSTAVGYFPKIFATAFLIFFLTPCQAKKNKVFRKNLV